MTYRDFYNAVINGEVTDEMVVFATEAIAKLDARNASRKEKPSKKSIENEPIKAKISEVLGDEPKTASEIRDPSDILHLLRFALLLSIPKQAKLTRLMIVK